MPHERARIWFFTDVHGSNECFRKFLRTIENSNRPNVLIIGGDITGKWVVPLVETSDGRVVIHQGSRQVAIASELVSSAKTRLADIGVYPWECNEQQYKQFCFDPNAHQSVVDSLVRERVSEWTDLADRSLPSPEQCQVFVNPGNDDPLFVDAMLDRSNRLIRPEGRVIDLPCGLKLLSTGYSNQTPWNCPRDVGEAVLRDRIADMTRMLSPDDLRRAIFNFHCPPKNTALDLAISIDPETLRPHAGFHGAQRAHVGSQAVREALEVWQPAAGLHGHIHEVSAKDHVGATACFNPGTDYRTGHLQGVFLQFDSLGRLEADVITSERTRSAHPFNARAFVVALLSMVPGLGQGIDTYERSAQLDRLLEQVTKLGEEVRALRPAAPSAPPQQKPTRRKNRGFDKRV